MNFSVFSILLIALKLTSASYSVRILRRDVATDENLHDNWYNMDQDLEGSHPDQDIAPAHFSFNLHMEFPQHSEDGEKMIPIVKNPMWIDKLAIIKAPPMYPMMLDDSADETIPINYRTRSMDRNAYQMMKIRRRRSTQQNTKKSPRQSDKKSKFKAWLESKMDKKLGEKFSERIAKLKPSLNRQTRSVEKNHITETKDEEENRINRASNCSNCGGLNQACPFCHSPFLIGPIYPPRPQFIEFINGEPRTYIPGSPHHSSIVGAAPRYIYDQLGHKYLERDGMLQILPPTIVDSPIVAIPSNSDYMQMLSETIQRYPHFHTSHRFEDGHLTEDLIQQTKDILEFIKGLTQSQNYEKNHQKRHTQKYNSNKDVVAESIVDEDEISALLMEEDRDFEKYLEQIGYTGKVGMFEMPDMEMNDQNPSAAQSIFYDTSMSTSKLAVPSAKKPQHHTSGTTFKHGSQVYQQH